MKKQPWKLGDLCYIADVNIEKNRMRFRVMPARVVHIAGITNTIATAQSANPPQNGLGYYELFTEGDPFPTQWSAILHTWREMRKNYISLFMPIRFEGEVPEMEGLSADIPALGQIIYGLDAEMREIFEARVGFLRYEYGRVDVGYDQSSGNAEASNVRIRQWWLTRAAAEAHVQEIHGETWAFVSKEQLAERVNAEINKIWSDASIHAQSPEFKAQMAKFAETLR